MFTKSLARFLLGHALRTSSSQKAALYFTLTVKQVSNPPRHHQAILARQILSVVCSFLGPAHHDVNLIAPLRHPQFDPVFNVETQATPKSPVMILAVHWQQNEFCYSEDDRNVFGSCPKVALSKSNLMTSVVTQRTARHETTCCL